LCAGCGRHEDEFAIRLDVHHISPARSFEDPAARNAESNLVALCRLCHQRWEGVPIRPQLL
jgi:5-methylcytosine-specific restriction endonuclease McrA